MSPGSIRTTRRTIVFAYPFTLAGLPEVQPPGTYAVDTDEEMIEGRSTIGYRRVATSLEVRRDGATQIFPIDPVELDAALLRDAGSGTPLAKT